MSQKAIKVLLVDDDEDFIRYVLSIASAFNLLIETSKSVKEALELIRNRSFDAYLIDLNLPDGSGFQLIEEARARTKAPIASISGVFHDNETFRKLKETYSVDYILGKPVYYEQVERLFLTLSSLKEKRVGSDPKEKLLQYYRGTICDKIDELSKLISGAQHHADTASLEALKGLLHKIAGSAGTYGFMEVTVHCRKVEQELHTLLETGNIPTKKWLSDLSGFLEQIKYDFQFPAQERSDKVEQSRPLRNTLFILDPDSAFLTLIEREKEAYPFTLLTESNPETGKELLQSPEFNPAAVVVAQKFPGFRFSGSDLIDMVRKKPGYQPTLFGILSEHESLDLRVRLSEKKIENFFLKPISPLVLLGTIAAQMPTLSQGGFKVLVLDDDEDICRFVQEALQECGINTVTIQDPENLFVLLEEFSPDYLIIDVLLPKYNGLDLLKTIQADPIFSKIPILIITYFREESVSDAAYGSNSVDVMFKPLNKRALQKIVSRAAKEKARGQELSRTSFRTGLSGVAALNKALLENLPPDTYLIFFEIQNFEGLVLQRGSLFTNTLLVNISNQLIGLEDSALTPYFIEPHRFALLVKSDSYELMQKELFDLLLEARNAIAENVNFCAGLVPVSNTSKPSEMIHAALEALRIAERDDNPSPVKIHTGALQENNPMTKEVILVDPDPDLQYLIGNTLRSRGITFHAFSSGESFLEVLKTYSPSQLPSLIIAERKLPEMDGIVLLDKLKKQFKQKIPFFFLTVYSSDQDISEGLSHGAVDYIIKPFNMKILTEKILAAIEG